MLSVCILELLSHMPLLKDLILNSFKSEISILERQTISFQIYQSLKYTRPFIAEHQTNVYETLNKIFRDISTHIDGASEIINIEMHKQKYLNDQKAGFKSLSFPIFNLNQAVTLPHFYKLIKFHLENYEKMFQNKKLFVEQIVTKLPTYLMFSFDKDISLTIIDQIISLKLFVKNKNQQTQYSLKSVLVWSKGDFILLHKDDATWIWQGETSTSLPLVKDDIVCLILYEKLHFGKSE